MSDEHGYVRNCFIRLPEGEYPPLFGQTADGHVVTRLDGMAIIPRDEYERLVRAAAGQDDREYVSMHNAAQWVDGEPLVCAVRSLTDEEIEAALPPVHDPNGGRR